MASNTRGVRRVSLRGPIQGPQTDPSGPLRVSFPGGEYQDTQTRRDDFVTESMTEPMMELEAVPPRPSLVSQESTLPGVANAADLARIAGMTKEPPGPTRASNKFSSEDTVQQRYLKDTAESQRLQEVGAYADMTAGVLKSVGGVINANAKYSQTINRNNFNLQMAEIQALQVASDARGKMLKEQTKGVARGQNAQLAAVAQGQAAGGDIATTAMSNEEVYAAENMMALEVNSMRQIFGIESQARMIESGSRMAEIQREAEVTQAIAGGVQDVAMGALQLPM